MDGKTALAAWALLSALALAAPLPAQPAAPQPLRPGEAELRVEPAHVGENLIANGSFEAWEGQWPAGWRWDPRNTDATASRDSTRAHSGHCSLKLTNGTRFGPHVYGQLLYAEPIAVEAGAQYTVSAWVQSEAGGIGWVGGADRWRVRAHWPEETTGGRWVRVSETFTTEAGETQIRLMIITESPTMGVWVDDVKLEREPEATPFVTEGTQAVPEMSLQIAGRGRSGEAVSPWMPDRYPPAQFVFGDELWVTGTIMGAAGQQLRVLAVPAGAEPRPSAQSIPAGAGARFSFRRDLSDLTDERLRLQVGVAGAEPLSYDLTVISRARILDRVAALEPMIAQLRARVEAMGERGAYPRVTLTVAERFVQYIRADMESGQLARAWAQAESVERMLREALARSEWPEAPRYVTSPVQIDGPSFVGDVRWPDGRTARRPVFFVGMGHFGQARRDVDAMPDLGMNIIQIEFGPSSVLPTEDTCEEGPIRDFLAVCDRAAAAGTQVNLLISPHYFPAWALEKWPHLRECSGGFLRFCVHAPEAREVLRRYLQYTIPRIAGHPALHSVCLTNEPVSTHLTQCRYTCAAWHQWLADRYATVEALNEAWSSDFAAISEVPVPEARFEPSPLVYDFARFNQEQFAAFHRFLADTIHEMAPELPVHAKMMVGALTGPSVHGPWCIAPELFAPFCAINGNDAVRWYRRQGEWASSFEVELMGFELQRCARDAPVFNSEDHLIPDRDISWVAPEHIYNVYWQGAVHGRGASTTWVWERTDSLDSDFTGSILHRPECVEAAGRCALDLNRLAAEVTALQGVRPRVALVYALAGWVWDGDYQRVLLETWRASTFAGHKTGFVYERQLEALAEGRAPGGYLADLEVIVLPGLRHLSAAAMRGLERFVADGGRLIAVGAAPEHDEHGRPCELRAPLASVADLRDEALMVALDGALRAAGVVAPSRLVGADGAPVYGVEHLAAPWEDGWLVNLSNYRHEEPIASLLIEGRAVTGASVLNGGGTLALPTAIPSLRPLLLQVQID
ncbi:MAG: beta-galactosidase [Armatimonadota bacterium]